MTDDHLQANDAIDALLARSEVWEDPPPGLEDTVVAAIAAEARSASASAAPVAGQEAPSARRREAPSARRAIPRRGTRRPSRPRSRPLRRRPSRPMPRAHGPSGGTSRCSICRWPG